MMYTYMWTGRICSLHLIRYANASFSDEDSCAQILKLYICHFSLLALKCKTTEMFMMFMMFIICATLVMRGGGGQNIKIINLAHKIANIS